MGNRKIGRESLSLFPIPYSLFSISYLNRVPQLSRHPIHVLLALEHDDPARRRPAVGRLFGSLRPENSRRRAAVHGERGVDRAGGLGASRGSQRRRIEILRRLPAETAAEE